MTPKHLIALADSRIMGRVDHGRNGRLTFTYDPDWRTADDAYPLSLSMPLIVAEHSHAAVQAFLSGLLPDNNVVLNQWGRRFGVSARNPFALLSHVGEDCAGAVQFVRPDRLDALERQSRPDIEWVTEADIADRLRRLNADHAAWRIPGDHGQFSLAGAKPKTALLNRAGQWGVPAGRTPTTHILKPPTPDFDGIVENEHCCLRLAQALGLPVATSRIATFEDQVAIVVERFDRVHTKNTIVRVHQEDGCQALAVRPEQKYENEGGPGVVNVVELLRNFSSDPETDTWTFIDALMFNWLIAGTDAHAKNYAFLLGAGGRVRLAPLYDLTSALPYPSLDPRRIKFAMRIGGEYLVRRVGAAHWTKLATQPRLPANVLFDRLIRMVEQVPNAIIDVGRNARDSGLTHPMVAQLQTVIISRAREELGHLRATQ